MDALVIEVKLKLTFRRCAQILRMQGIADTISLAGKFIADT